MQILSLESLEKHIPSIIGPEVRKFLIIKDTKWITNKILVGKTLEKNVQIDPQTTEIRPKQLNDP